MAEQKESSVLFSLKELMNLEEDRIRQEEADKKRQEEAAIQARMEAERRVREEEQARLRAAEDERLAVEARAREETARLEAMRQAQVERARAEAENAARLEQIRRQQEHERQLMALQQDKSKQKLTWIAAASGAFFLIAVTVGGIALYNSNKAAEELKAQIGQMKKDEADLVHKIENSSGEERARYEKELADKQAKLEQLQKQDQPNGTPVAKPKFTGPAGAKPAADPNAGKPKEPCKCAPGDPLCPCL